MGPRRAPLRASRSAGPGRGAAEGPIASVAMAASTAARPGRKTRVLARTALPSAGHSYSRVACLHDHHAGKQARRLYDVGKIYLVPPSATASSTGSVTGARQVKLRQT